MALQGQVRKQTRRALQASPESTVDPGAGGGAGSGKNPAPLDRDLTFRLPLPPTERVILEEALPRPYSPLENGLGWWFPSLAAYQNHEENHIRNKSRFPGLLLEVLIL